MEKIRDYILKGKEIFVGLEDSKKSWKVCVRSGRTVVNETSMPAQYDNLKGYFQNKFPDCKIRVLYEAGFRGFTLRDKLAGDGWIGVVTPAHLVTQEKCSSQKNDRIDARRLSKNNENGDYRECHVPDRQRREDRQISRIDSQLQQDIVRVCNRIRRMMEYHGLEEHFPGGNWSAVKYREAEETIKGLEMSQSLRFAFEMYFKELNFLREMQKEVRQQLTRLAKSERYAKPIELLKSAPGTGQLTSIRLALEWGDVGRFERKEAFGKYLGLIPSEYSSGEKEHKGHITKQGNRQVRRWLIESAWTAIKHDPILLEKYQTVSSHTGSGKKAIVAVARKLSMRLRAVLIKGKPYQVGLEN